MEGKVKAVTEKHVSDYQNLESLYTDVKTSWLKSREEIRELTAENEKLVGVVIKFRYVCLFRLLELNSNCVAFLLCSEVMDDSMPGTVERVVKHSEQRSSTPNLVKSGSKTLFSRK